MNIYPTIELSLGNGFLLILPLLLLRFGLPAIIQKATLGALDQFPPVNKVENIALKIYFVTNTFLIFSPILARVHCHNTWAVAGWICYLTGVVFLSWGLFNFSSTASGQMVTSGIYRFSRNPIYMGYFFIFIGVAFIIGSWTHLVISIIYQISVHFLIKSEERWCETNFAASYREYKSRVRRYL